MSAKADKLRAAIVDARKRRSADVCKLQAELNALMAKKGKASAKADDTANDS
jgi:hypothetical protein